MPLSLFPIQCGQRGEGNEWGGTTMKQASVRKICLYNPQSPSAHTHHLHQTVFSNNFFCFPSPFLFLISLSYLYSISAPHDVHPPLPVDNWGSHVWCYVLDPVRVCVYVWKSVAGNEPGLRGRGATKTEWGRAARAAYLAQHCSTTSNTHSGFMVGVFFSIDLARWVDLKFSCLKSIFTCPMNVFYFLVIVKNNKD